MTSGQSQVSLRSVSGQSQGSLRSVSGLFVFTSSDRRSLKYFVLLLLPSMQRLLNPRKIQITLFIGLIILEDLSQKDKGLFFVLKFVRTERLE